MKALVLAGGLGTRLRSLVPDRPKPMAAVREKPFLEYLVQQVRAQGFTDLVLCVGYLAGQVEAYFGDGRRWGVRIAYASETELLGTAGALRNARQYIDGPFLALNGDSYLEVDLPALVARHRQHVTTDPRAIGTLASVAVAQAAAYGTLEMDRDGRILAFREKSTAGPGRVNGGIYVLEPEILDLITAGRAVSIEKEVFPLALERDSHLYGYPVEGFFVDIGTPDGYRSFQAYIKGSGSTVI